MKTIQVYFLVCFFFLTAAFVTVEAQTLTEIYSGQNLPAEEGWKELKLNNEINSIAGTASATIVDGTLKITASNNNAYTQLGWYKENPALDPVKGYTIDVKVKVNDASEYGAFNIQGFTPDGKGFRVGIYKTHIAASTNPLAATIVLSENMDNSDDFHTYRIAVNALLVYVYRDETLVGTFPVSKFYYDNLITNGGFEDVSSEEETFISNGWTVSGGLFERSDAENGVYSGSWGGYMEQGAGAGYPSYRSIPLKPDVSYDFSAWYKTITYIHPNGWRDFEVWLNEIGGAGTNVVKLMGFEASGSWRNPKTVVKGSTSINKLLMHLPCNDQNVENKTAIDDLVLTEKLPQPDRIPEGITNLFPNGDFEDPTGYVTCTTNQCPDWHPTWGARVRLLAAADGESGPYFARSGNYSLRYFSCMQADPIPYGEAFDPNFSEGRGKNSDLNYTQILDPGKTYTLSFWHHAAHWGGDNIPLVVRNGSIELMRKTINNTFYPDWVNEVITFTTTATDHELKIQTERKSHTGCVLYFDDFVLFEGEAASQESLASYLFFGKSTGVESTDVDVQSISYNLDGAYAPNGQEIEIEYIEVGTAEEFNNIREDMEGYYRLTADIDLSSYEDFTPIGTLTNPFRGELQGDYYMITGLSIYAPDKSEQGLFGYAEGARFANLKIKDTMVEGHTNVGTLLGKGTSVNIQQVAVVATEVVGETQVGGLVGAIEGGRTSHINNCYVSNGDILSIISQAGGLLGVAQNTRVENAYFNGIIYAAPHAQGNNAGGIIAVSNNANVSLVGVVSLAERITGGTASEFVARGTALAENTNSYARNDGVLSNNIGDAGLGRATTEQLKPLASFQSQALYTSMSWDFDKIWTITNGKFPVLKNEREGSGSNLNEAPVVKNLKIYRSDVSLVFKAINPASVSIYNTSGVLVDCFDIQKTNTITLPKGIYIVRSVSNGTTETVKVAN